MAKADEAVTVAVQALAERASAPVLLSTTLPPLSRTCTVTLTTPPLVDSAVAPTTVPPVKLSVALDGTGAVATATEKSQAVLLDARAPAPIVSAAPAVPVKANVGHEASEPLSTEKRTVWLEGAARGLVSE